MALTREVFEVNFGAANICAWADLNNMGNAKQISDRIARAFYVAAAQFRFKMGGLKPLPVTTDAVTVAEEIQYKMAAIWLYESRGIPEDAAQSVIAHHKDEVEHWFAMYAAGKLSFSIPTGPISF